MNRFVCHKCGEYEEQLKQVINELSSAKTIIRILQKELCSTRNIGNMCVRNQIVTKGPGKKQITKEWALITPKNNTEKPRAHDKRNKNKFTTFNQPITTTNRFILLSNLEEDNTESTEFQNQEQHAQIHKIHKSMKQQTTGQTIPTIVNGQAQYTVNGKQQQKQFPNRNYKSGK